MELGLTRRGYLAYIDSTNIDVNGPPLDNFPYSQAPPTADGNPRH